MQEATNLLVWGIVIHLVADWLLQTDWMALNKSDWRHPAAWLHGSIHTLGLCLVFAWPLALGIGLTHLLIDTRKPVLWWIGRIKRIPPNTQPVFVEVWLDQVMHVTVLAGAALCAVWFSFI